MSISPTIAHWEEEVRSHLPHLSRPQARILAMWSYATVVSNSCGLTTVVSLLSRLLLSSKANLRQRLREWCYDAKDKAGRKRAELDVHSCFAPLLKWILSRWPDEHRQLALAIDATTLSSRFTVLAISVLYRGCAMPVAWSVMNTHQKGAWRPLWEELLRALAPAVPADWMVIVTADRGLYAPWLYQQIVERGWHPFLRLNEEVLVQTEGSQDDWQTAAELVHQEGEHWQGKVICGKEEGLGCFMHIAWGSGYEEAWIIVSDLSVEHTSVAWYQMRFWVEGGFKDQKRGGWQWHQTKMRDPRRAERVWLVLAVAALWTIAVGGQAEAEHERYAVHPASVPQESRQPEQQTARPNKPRGREESCVLQGRLIIVSTVMRGEALPLGCFLPQAWPEQMPAILASTAQWAKRKREKQQKRREKQRRKERKRAQKRRKKTYP